MGCKNLERLYNEAQDRIGKRKYLHATFNTGAMVAERAAKNGVQFVHSLPRSRLCSRLPLPHGASSFPESTIIITKQESQH